MPSVWFEEILVTEFSLCRNLMGSVGSLVRSLWQLSNNVINQ